MSDTKQMSVEKVLERRCFCVECSIDDIEDLIAAVRAECAAEYLVNELDMKGATKAFVERIELRVRAEDRAKMRELAESIRKEDIGDGTAEYFAEQIERIAKEGT